MMLLALLLSAIVVAALSGVVGVLFSRRSETGSGVSAALMVSASVAGTIAAARALFGGERASGQLQWNVPGGLAHVELDALSAMFLLQIFVIAGLGAIYGIAYWRQADHPEGGRRLRLFYGLTVAGMATLVIARNSVLFLVGWEVMALSTFVALTSLDHEKPVREAGFLYLMATRAGTLCLIGMFALLAADTATTAFPSSQPVRPEHANAIFLLGLVGFGMKAGIMPMHVWLPGAHANAPTHFSAVMSGVLIKMGIYGLLRLTSMFVAPPLWWGMLLLGLGVVSGVLGVALAIGQHDVKRLLAYHSVENIGIITMGLGVAMLGRSLGSPVLETLGLAGALLHTWNHGLFKALLFFSAGSVIHAVGTREIDRMGGLLRRMPYTGALFLVGAVAICGLPPLNGFVSELLVYLGLFQAVASPGPAGVPAAFALASLALVGGLALACFVKVFGTVFLGEPRTEAAAHAHESPAWMLVPMGVLAALCLAIGIGPVLVGDAVYSAVVGWDVRASSAPLGTLVPLHMVSIAALAIAVPTALLWLMLRSRVKEARSDVPTWDCGYAAPSARMQYTASSFAQMIVGLFGWALRPHEHAPGKLPLFPANAHFESHVPDAVLDEAVVPLAIRIADTLGKLRVLQSGSVHLYLVYVLATIILLFLWP